ncbi:hypothetical protein, variant [Salpingoeca rosetta]|nr:hypothetical protein, variant [Salpingoeca rosetta]EGD79730.1 hypothetical protein, variant [Salpingoeca rosetta]|eukprot:XP_004988679.1 hypothetical protein, variant [Salpingoeca rosetta]
MLSQVSRRVLATAGPALRQQQRLLTVTVCGGGNAAHVAAGMFSNQGAEVKLFFSFERLEEILNTVHKHTKYSVGGHFLNTTLWCTNAIIHPGISYGIWHDWDGKPVAEQPLFYQNCNDFTANVLQTLSDEIQACRDVIAARTTADMSKWQPIAEYMVDVYGHVISDTSSLAKIFATNDAFRGLTAPCTQLDDGTFMPNFNTRYLTEEKIGHEYLVDGKIQGGDVSHSGCPQRFGIKTVEQLVG